MTSLTLFDSSGNMPFWSISAAILIVIATMWLIFRQKISDNNSAYATKIINDRSTHDTQIDNAELGKIYTEIEKITVHYDNMVNNLTMKLNTIEEACCNNNELEKKFYNELERMRTENT